MEIFLLVLKIEEFDIKFKIFAISLIYLQQQLSTRKLDLK